VLKSKSGAADNEKADNLSAYRTFPSKSPRSNGSDVRLLERAMNLPITPESLFRLAGAICLAVVAWDTRHLLRLTPRQIHAEFLSKPLALPYVALLIVGLVFSVLSYFI
jgi:hypothetical protein